jgi:hypothetical protein
VYIAYLDEFGHIGPYVAKDDPRYKTHPVFGLGGIILPANRVRDFGAFFQDLKKNLLAFEIQRDGVHPGRWEKKGASLLTTRNVTKYPEVRVAMNRILNRIESSGGKVFFYGQVKPIGGPSEIEETSRHRYDHTMVQGILRATAAVLKADNLMMILDEVDDKSRLEALASSAAFMYSNWRAKQLIEAPLQVESHLYASVQAADWICALLSRISAYQSGPDWGDFEWAERYFSGRVARVATASSKIHSPLAPHTAITPKTLHMAAGNTSALIAICHVCAANLVVRGKGFSRRYFCVQCDMYRLG